MKPDANALGCIAFLHRSQRADFHDTILEDPGKTPKVVRITQEKGNSQTRVRFREQSLRNTERNSR
jgi:hypothetical protein